MRTCWTDSRCADSEHPGDLQLMVSRAAAIAVVLRARCMSLEVPNTLATDLRRGSLARSKMIVVCLTSLPSLPTSFVRLADRDRSQVFGDESGKSGCSRRPLADMIWLATKCRSWRAQDHS